MAYNLRSSCGLIAPCRGVPYFYEQQAIIEQAKTCMRVGSNNRVSICSFCSRMKRGVLYHTARREGYNVLAMVPR